VLPAGVGIAQRGLRSLFKEYVQGSEEEMKRPRSRGGTGLGLSICSKQVCACTWHRMQPSELKLSAQLQTDAADNRVESLNGARFNKLVESRNEALQPQHAQPARSHYDI